MCTKTTPSAEVEIIKANGLRRREIEHHWIKGTRIHFFKKDEHVIMIISENPNFAVVHTVFDEIAGMYPMRISEKEVDAYIRDGKIIRKKYAPSSEALVEEMIENFADEEFITPFLNVEQSLRPL